MVSRRRTTTLRRRGDPLWSWSVVTRSVVTRAARLAAMGLCALALCRPRGGRHPPHLVVGPEPSAGSTTLSTRCEETSPHLPAPSQRTTIDSLPPEIKLRIAQHAPGFSEKRTTRIMCESLRRSWVVPWVAWIGPSKRLDAYEEDTALVYYDKRYREDVPILGHFIDDSTFQRDGRTMQYTTQYDLADGCVAIAPAATDPDAPLSDVQHAVTHVARRLTKWMRERGYKDVRLFKRDGGAFGQVFTILYHKPCRSSRLAETSRRHWDQLRPRM